MYKTLSVDEYKNKVYGAWAGKCAGGIVGAKQENNKSIMHYTFDNVFPDKIPPNDDFDLQMLYLQEILEKKGFNFTSNDIGEEFAKHNECWANEYRVAIKNIDGGIMPPMSGKFCNDFFHSSNGCPIRSELWGLVAPGNPEFVMECVEKDGCVDHCIESIETEKFFAVLECKAFFETDVKKLIYDSLRYLSPDSCVSKCAHAVVEEWKKNDDWRVTRANLIRRFGSSDASYAVVNMGIVLLALLYGGGNFNDTMLIAVNCGYDTDCTSATAGSIMGILYGKDGIGKDWLEKIGEKFVVGTVDIVRKRNTLSQLTDDTFALAFSLVRDGLNDIKFTGVPADYVCNIPKYCPRVESKAEYGDLPSIAPDQEREFTVSFTNKTDKTIDGELVFDLCKDLEGELSESKMSIKSGETKTIHGKVRVHKGVKELAVRNVCKVTFDYGAGSAVQKVGFAGEASYRLYGPFFDNYDTEKYETDVNGEKMPIDLFSMFNGFVNIDNEYVTGDEPSGDNYITFTSAQDKIPVEEKVTYKGPCCVYLVREVFCEEEQDIHMIIGNSAPYKIFFNGEPVAWYNGANMCWMPLNHTIELKLKKGKNVFVYKLVRRNGKFEFSTILSKKEFGSGVLVDMVNKY